MRVAVAGSSGLVGGPVAAHLERSCDVVRLGRQPECDIQVDLDEPASVAALDLHGCDALVHCAGVTDEDLRARPEQAWRRTTLGMRLLVDGAVEAGVGAVAYVSTSHVYGPPAGRIDENTCPAPVGDYAIGHYAAERVLASAAGDGGLRGLVLRPNAVFGMPDLGRFHRWHLIPYAFPAEAVYDGQIVLRSSGEQRRNLVSTEDLAERIGDFLAAGPRGLTVLNPIGPETLTVYELASRCADVAQKLTGHECRVRRPPSAVTEPGSDFVYASVHGGARPGRGIGEYLEAMIGRLLEEGRDGRRYGR